MWWIAGLVASFLLIVVFGSGNDRRRRKDFHGLLMQLPASSASRSIFSGWLGNLLNRVAVKSGLIAIFLLTTPRLAGKSHTTLDDFPARNRALKKLRKKGSSLLRLYLQGIKIPDKALKGFEKLYDTSLSESPGERATAHLIMSEVQGALRNFDLQREYLLKGSSCLDATNKYLEYFCNVRLGWSLYLENRSGREATELIEKAFKADAMRGVFPLALSVLLTENDFTRAADLLQQTEGESKWQLLYAMHHYLFSDEKWELHGEAWKNFLEGSVKAMLPGRYDEAERCFESSASQGFLPALVGLADLRFGKGEVAGAKEIITEAADAFYPPAVHRLGYYIYTASLGRMMQHKSIKKTAELWKKGAELGYPPSLLTTGGMYLNGYAPAVTPDPVLAEMYLQAANEAAEGMKIIKEIERRQILLENRTIKEK